MNKTFGSMMSAAAIGAFALATAGTAGAHDIYVSSDNDRDNHEDRGHSAISFGIGDVAVGYRDGYWDNRHSWHHWRNDHDYQDYRGNGNNYHDWNHDRGNYEGRGHSAISFGFGDVAFGYRDGYWDNRHSWHHWRNNRDYRNYRGNGNNYHNWNHDRDGDNGWLRHY